MSSRRTPFAFVSSTESEGRLHVYNTLFPELFSFTHSPHLVFRTGKDNRTFLWDLFTLKPIAEVPNDVPQQQPAQNDGSNSDALFSNNGGLASSHQRRYDVQWSPIKRGVASTCSLDRKVQAHSILGLSSKSGRPPKWMRPSSSVSCAFGGALVNCSSADKFIRIRTIVEEPNLVTVSKGFEHSMDTTNVVDYCKDLESKARDDGEQQLWGFMHVIFETNARQELLAHLGFNPSSIAEAASKYSAAEDVTAEMETMSLDQKMSMTTNAQEMVKKALLVGNFEAAVDCCFNVGHSADALILASCGGPELWAKTQARYFEEQSSKRPFLSMVNSIMQNNLGELVQSSETGKWRETLAVLSTYGKSDEFPQLCIALGDRLEEAGNSRDASLCYMCALSLDKAVSYWRGQLHDANKASGDMDILALHKFVMKVSIFLLAAGSSAVLNAQDSELFSTYAKKLAEQGLLVEAAKYCKGDDYESKLLRDRLYRSKASPACLAAMGGAPPEFPFQMENISQSRGQVFAADVRAAEEQRALQQKQYQEQQEQQQAQLRAQQEQHQQQASTAAAAAPSSAVSFLVPTHFSRLFPFNYVHLTFSFFFAHFLLACCLFFACWLDGYPGPSEWQYVLRESNDRRSDLGPTPECTRSYSSPRPCPTTCPCPRPNRHISTTASSKPTGLLFKCGYKQVGLEVWRRLCDLCLSP